MPPLRVNADGSLPMELDAWGRPKLCPDTVTELAALASGQGAHPDLAAHEALGLSAEHAHDYAAPHAHPYAATVHTHAYAATGHTHAIADGDIPAGIARDAEVAAAIATHAATPHGGEGGGFQFPVGALYLTVDATNPGTVFGYGTWALFGVGRFLVGTDSQAGVTGGSATHTHAAHTGVINHTHPVTDPGHAHVENSNNATTGGLRGWGAPDTSTNTSQATGYSTASATTGVTTANPAGGVASLTHDAVSNEPPSISAFIWQRTA